MKNIKITITLNVTEEAYGGMMKDMKSEIACGKFQRDIVEPDNGINNVKAVFETIK